jgi:glycosyltransferase involved in cell wall biosynthesis
VRGRRFLEHAAGITVIVARLLEHVPDSLPSAVVGAGFDEAVLKPVPARAEVRAEIGLAHDDLAIVYTGSIHRVNLPDMRDLYSAVRALRRDGYPIVLVKTGTNTPAVPDLPELGEGLRDLGLVPRAAVAGVLSAADVLVQPGRPGPYNDYRLPSKLPEFLASGKPVVLPRANLGLELENGEEALVLDHGDSDEIAAAVARLADSPELRRSIGSRGRAFALRELRWERVVDAIVGLYREIGDVESTAVGASP